VSEELRLVPIVNRILMGLLDLDAKWIGRGHSLPVGLPGGCGSKSRVDCGIHALDLSTVTATTAAFALLQ
jgi:hypothetical protein